MSFAVQFLLIILLIQGESEGSDNALLYSLIQRVHYFRPISSLVIFHDNRSRNCTLRDWNPQGIPSLRSTQLGGFQVRGNFNDRALALVCIVQENDIELLDAVAKTYEHMRQERVMLWSQVKVTKSFLDEVGKKVSQHKFLHMLLLEVGGQSSGLISSRRLDPFPTPHFVQIEDIFNSPLGSFYILKNTHFGGMTAVVKTIQSFGFRFPTKFKTPDKQIPEHRIEDKAFFEFAIKANLNVRFTDSETDHYDIQLGPRFIRKNTLTQLGYTTPSVSLSLIVLVPCGQERSIAEVFKRLDVQTWLLYIFCVYALLILVETFIIVVTHRISGRAYRPTRINPLVNLRVFGAILGMSFPVNKREILSLRQLFLAMSIFGMVFSSFFSCKLSALLTKIPDYPQVTNFEELRASGLTVIADNTIRGFIENEIDSQFFQQVMPNTKFMPFNDRFRLLFTLNDSYGHLVLDRTLPVIRFLERSSERKAFCTSNDLIVANNLPTLFMVANNSYFKWPLSKVVMSLQEAGIDEHWLRESPEAIRRLLNITTLRTVSQGAKPLTLKQLKLLWYLLILGYGIASSVFLVEIFLGRGKRGSRRTRRVDLCPKIVI